MREEIQEFARDCYEDPVLFCKFFLDRLFPLDMPWVHRGLLSILTGQTAFLHKYGEVEKIVSNFVTEGDDPRPLFVVRDTGEIDLELGKNTLIMLPRGFSKTTLCGLAVPLYNILFQVDPLTVYLSETGPHSKMQMANVKSELATNDRIRAIFGTLKPKMTDDERWAQDMFETTTGFAMAARSRGSQVRGLNHKGNRPSRFIVDDLEDRESVNTDDQRVKTRIWFYGDVIPAIAELNPNSTMVCLGTLLHQEALLQYLRRDPTWTVVVFGARDKQGDWLWPALMDAEKYETKKKSATLANMLHVFYMEYENQYRAPETALIRQDMIQHRVPESPVLATSIYIDPAISEKLDADRTWIVAVSMTECGIIRIRRAWMKRGAHPREQIDMYFEFFSQFRPQRAGIETNAYQRALAHLIEEEMARKRLFFEPLKINATDKKDERIRGILTPRFAANYITFDYPMPELEMELLDYPAGLKDGPDALAGAISLLDDYHAAAYPDDPAAATEPPLLDEIGGEWRWAQ